MDENEVCLASGVSTVINLGETASRTHRVGITEMKSHMSILYVIILLIKLLRLLLAPVYFYIYVNLQASYK
jgi:hypothetical protein